MKIFILVLLSVFLFNQSKSQDSLKKYRTLSSDSIVVNPQPFKSGDLIVSLITKDTILSTYLYNITGDLIYQQSHQNTITFNYIMQPLEEGEYILKVETDSAVGIKKIRIK